MNMKRLLWGFTLIAATALLAGCGGGGGTSLMVGGERATQALIDALQADRNAQANRADEAERERDARPTQQDLTDAQGERNAAHMTLAAIRTELGLMADADQAAIVAAITALEMRNPADPEDPAIATLRTSLGLASDASLAMIVAAVGELVAEDMRMEDPIAAKKAPAIADPDNDKKLYENDSAERGTVTNSATDVTATEDDLENPNRPGKGEADDGSDDLFSVTAGAIDTEPTMTIGPSTSADRLGMPDQAIPDEDEFVRTADGTVDGFARNVHTRTVDGVTTDTVTVLDNRAAPEDVAYRVFYDDPTDTDRSDAQDLNSTVDRDAVDSIDANGVLNLDEGDIDNNHGLFSASAFPSGEDQEFTYEDDVPNTDANEERRGGRDFRGMFNGVPGRFACTGNAGTCTAGTDSMGRLDSLGGVWTFTPDDVDDDADPHMIRGAKYDADYLAFGYWLQGTTVRGNTTYKIGTFATGSMPFAGTDFAAAIMALTGSATYSGPAAGMFVMKTDIDGDSKGPVATEAGKFTADTELTAKFGDATATPDDFTISGTVENFQLTNHDDTSVANDWSLNLNSARFATPTYSATTGLVTGIADHVRTFSGTTGETGSLGRWEGGFYGPQVEDDTDTATVDESVSGYPTGVAGEFIGHFGNGHAIGAFGAELDP